MESGSVSLMVLVVLTWGSLAALVGVFLSLALRPDAGYGAAGKFFGRGRAMPPRTGVTPVAIPPRHVSRSFAHRS